MKWWRGTARSDGRIGMMRVVWEESWPGRLSRREGLVGRPDPSGCHHGSYPVRISVQSSETTTGLVWLVHHVLSSSPELRRYYSSGRDFGGDTTGQSAAGEIMLAALVPEAVQAGCPQWRRAIIVFAGAPLPTRPSFFLLPFGARDIYLASRLPPSQCHCRRVNTPVGSVISRPPQSVFHSFKV